MIVTMDMASGRRLDKEEALGSAQECGVASRVPPTSAQLEPQLGLQLAIGEFAPRRALRKAPLGTEHWVWIADCE